MQTRDYSAIALALALLETRGHPSPHDSYHCGWADGVEAARINVADAIAAHDPAFDREDFLKLTRGE